MTLLEVFVDAEPPASMRFSTELRRWWGQIGLVDDTSHIVHHYTRTVYANQCFTRDRTSEIKQMVYAKLYKTSCILILLFYVCAGIKVLYPYKNSIGFFD